MNSLINKLVEAISTASKKDLRKCKDVAKDKSYTELQLPEEVSSILTSYDLTDEIRELVKYQLLKAIKTDSVSIKLDMSYNEFNKSVRKLKEIA